MVAEDFMQKEAVAHIRTIVREAVRPFLYSKKYKELDSEEKYHLLCEEITNELCLSKL